MNIESVSKSISEETGVDEQKVKEIIDKYNESLAKEAIKQLEKVKEKKNEPTYVGPPMMETQLFLMLSTNNLNDL